MTRWPGKTDGFPLGQGSGRHLTATPDTSPTSLDAVVLVASLPVAPCEGRANFRAGLADLAVGLPIGMTQAEVLWIKADGPVKDKCRGSAARGAGLGIAPRPRGAP